MDNKVDPGSASQGLHVPSASSDDQELQRPLISPATIVNIKHKLGKSRHVPQASASALEDWKYVRGPKRSSDAGVHELEGTSSGFSVRPLRDPRTSIASSSFGANLVQEPASYANSPTPSPGLHQNGDIEYDSDDSHSGDEYAHYTKRRANKRTSQIFLPQAVSEPQSTLYQRFMNIFRLPALTAAQRGIIKCCIAYFVATLFTFVPLLSDLFAAPFDLEGPVSGAHVIATVSTYYNPAKTLGAMIEADIFMIWASLFALVTALGSMATAVALENAGLHELSHFVIVIFWLVGSMGLVAWMKVKVSNAQFGSACSMVALIISSVICKEGSVHQGIFQTQTISQTFATVILGTLISNAVCFLVWRGSATSKLQGDINKSLESFATLLDMLCHAFLSEESTLSDEALKKAVDGHRSAFTALKTSLEAARLELWDYRIQRTQLSYDKIVASMNRLAQHINGLRSAVTLERELDLNTKLRSSKTGDKNNIEADDEVMKAFHDSVGPSLRGLAGTSKQALRDVRAAFMHSRAGRGDLNAMRAGDLENGATTGLDGLLRLKNELEDALKAYKTSHSKSIKRLYRHYPSNIQDEKAFFDDRLTPQLDTKPNERIFIIYYFCFNLEQFAKEQADLIDAFMAVRKEEELLEKERQGEGVRSSVMAMVSAIDVFGWFAARPKSHATTHKWSTLRKKIVRLMPFSDDKQTSPFPSTEGTAITSHSAAQERSSTFMGKVRRRTWEVLVKMSRPNVIYAVKTGVGCGVLGAFAFNHTTRPIFVRYSGNWAMLSYMVVVSTTVGATNFNAFFRIGGTIFGALTAVSAWFLLLGHPVLLCMASVAISIPCFWIIVTKPKFATSGRFILLSYNLTALYAYNVRSTGYDVEEIALHRTVSVIAGTLWGLVVTQYIFPFEARKELRQGISEFLVHSAFFYQELVEYTSVGPNDYYLKPTMSSVSVSSDERSPLVTPSVHKRPSKEKDFVQMETHLQLSLIKLGALIDHAKHEPRLKGPFPTGPYASVLKSCQRLLDALHAMSMVATLPEFHRTIRREITLKTHAERREVSGNILLFMSLLASDLSLKAPLPPYFPPALEGWKRLTNKIGSLFIIQKRAFRGVSPLILFYSYAMMEKDLIVQLENIGNVFQYLFGVLGDTEGTGTGVEAFEALFNQQQLEQSPVSDAESTADDSDRDEH